MQITEKWLDWDGPSGEPGRSFGQELRENRRRTLCVVACSEQLRAHQGCLDRACRRKRSQRDPDSIERRGRRLGQPGLAVGERQAEVRRRVIRVKTERIREPPLCVFQSPGAKKGRSDAVQRVHRVLAAIESMRFGELPFAAEDVSKPCTR